MDEEEDLDLLDQLRGTPHGDRLGHLDLARKTGTPGTKVTTHLPGINTPGAMIATTRSESLRDDVRDEGAGQLVDRPPLGKKASHGARPACQRATSEETGHLVEGNVEGLTLIHIEVVPANLGKDDLILRPELQTQPSSTYGPKPRSCLQNTLPALAQQTRCIVNTCTAV